MRAGLTARLVAAAMLGQGFAAHAILSVSPPHLHPNQRGLVMTEFTSQANVATRWAVSVVQWSQHGGTEALATRPDIEVSPRFFSLKPGAHQLVRARVPERDRYYRLVVQQIEDDASASNEAIRYQFRFSLPVFRSRTEPQQRALAVEPHDRGCRHVHNDTDTAQFLVSPVAYSGSHTVLPHSGIEICFASAAQR